MFTNTTAGRIVERRANYARPIRCPRGCVIASARSVARMGDRLAEVDLDEIVADHMREAHGRRAPEPVLTDAERAARRKVWDEIIAGPAESTGPFLNEPPF